MSAQMINIFRHNNYYPWSFILWLLCYN